MISPASKRKLFFWLTKIEGTETRIQQKTKNVASEKELYIPSADLLIAQDLLLDRNIVQELERLPHNLLPFPAPWSPVSVKRRAEITVWVEEAQDDLSGTPFMCENVIRSLVPNHNSLCRQKSLHMKFASPEKGPLGDKREEIVHKK